MKEPAIVRRRHSSPPARPGSGLAGYLSGGGAGLHPVDAGGHAPQPGGPTPPPRPVEWIPGAGSARADRPAPATDRQQAEDRALAAQSTIDAIISVDAGGRVVSWSNGATRMFGWAREEMVGRQISAIFPEHLVEAYEHAIAGLATDGGSLLGTTVDMRARRSNGEEFPVELSLSGWERDSERYLSAILRDVTVARRTAELAALVQQAATVANDCTGLAEAMVRLLPALGATGRAVAVRGWLDDLSGPPVTRWRTPAPSPADPGAGPATAGPVTAPGPGDADPGAVRVVARPEGGAAVGVPIVVDASLCGLLELDAAAAAREDTALLAALAQVGVQLGRVAERAASAAELTRRSLTDPLTGLGNVWQAEALLASEVLRVQGGTESAVVLLDLDRFRDVNDSVGFRAGNEVLRAVAARLGSRLRHGDALMRLGGDEFVMICSDLPDDLVAESVARRLVESFEEPFLAHGARIHLGASVGVVPVTPASTPEMLVGFAEIAMYRAKTAGGNRYVRFDADMETAVRSRLEMQSALREAVSRDELVLHYQPVVRPADGAVLGLEALVRWNRPGHGLVSPLEFIPIAEQSGLITAIGRHVLLEAARRLVGWRRERPDLDGLDIAVNVAAAQLTPGFPAMVAEVLESSGLPADRLVLEITEGALLVDLARTGALLSSIRALGVRIALDDFGTGYSSLSYLRQLPIDVLKIDRSFVEPFGTSARADAVIDAVLALAHALELVVVAEGVETSEQASGLGHRRCDALQGFHFSRPVPAAEVPAVLDRLGVAGAAPSGTRRDGGRQHSGGAAGVAVHAAGVAVHAAGSTTRV